MRRLERLLQRGGGEQQQHESDDGHSLAAEEQGDADTVPRQLDRTEAPGTLRVVEDEREHKKALLAVADLHVQSLVRGWRYPGCMVNNTLYRAGQQIGIFTVAKVTKGAVVVTYRKWSFELKMPG